MSFQASSASCLNWYRIIYIESNIHTGFRFKFVVTDDKLSATPEINKECRCVTVLNNTNQHIQRAIPHDLRRDMSAEGTTQGDN